MYPITMSVCTLQTSSLLQQKLCYLYRASYPCPVQCSLSCDVCSIHICTVLHNIYIYIYIYIYTHTHTYIHSHPQYHHHEHQPVKAAEFHATGVWTLHPKTQKPMKRSKAWSLTPSDRHTEELLMCTNNNPPSQSGRVSCQWSLNTKP
jgi:hypothetical protein